MLQITMGDCCIFYICIVVIGTWPHIVGQSLTGECGDMKDHELYGEVINRMRALELEVVKLREIESRVKELESEISLLKKETNTTNSKYTRKYT